VAVTIFVITAGKVEVDSNYNKVINSSPQQNKIIQFNSYLFLCKLSIPKANCKVSKSKGKENTHTNKIQKQGNLYHNSILFYSVHFLMIMMVMVTRTMMIDMQR
jgi:hypothetical protein